MAIEESLVTKENVPVNDNNSTKENDSKNECRFWIIRNAFYDSASELISSVRMMGEKKL